MTGILASAIMAEAGEGLVPLEVLTRVEGLYGSMFQWLLAAFAAAVAVLVGVGGFLIPWLMHRLQARSFEKEREQWEETARRELESAKTDLKADMYYCMSLSAFLRAKLAERLKELLGAVFSWMTTLSYMNQAMKTKYDSSQWSNAVGVIEGAADFAGTFGDKLRNDKDIFENPIDAMKAEAGNLNARLNSHAGQMGEREATRLNDAWSKFTKAMAEL